MRKNILYLFLAVLSFSIALYCLFFWNWKKKKYQKEEESLAADWIEYLISRDTTVTYNDEAHIENMQETKEAEGSTDMSDAVDRYVITVEEPLNSSVKDEMMEVIIKETIIDEKAIYEYIRNDDFSYVDDYYYSRGSITYTPDYALGVFTGVIYYEKCGLAREVFTARNNDEANANLDMWIPTIVNPRALVGWSSFTIKLHNHTEKKVSGNELGNAEIGDVLYFLTTESIYSYQVVDIYRMSRDLVELTLDNDPWGYPSTKMFLATCGRDDNFMVYKEKYMPSDTTYTSPVDIRELDLGQPTTSRYMDFIVEAELLDISPIANNSFALELVEKIRKMAE